MHRGPLRLTSPVRPLVFGGRSIERRLGREGLPDWAIAETWEVSDVEGSGSEVADGPFVGRSLRSLVEDFPEELMGRGWRGEFFPLLTKFIDAEGASPAHLHADDTTARRLENQVNGKTEAWHILEAAPGATALCGVREDVDRERLHRALFAQDFDSVPRRAVLRPRTVAGRYRRTPAAFFLHRADPHQRRPSRRGERVRPTRGAGPGPDSVVARSDGGGGGLGAGGRVVRVSARPRSRRAGAAGRRRPLPRADLHSGRDVVSTPGSTWGLPLPTASRIPARSSMCPQTPLQSHVTG